VPTFTTAIATTAQGPRLWSLDIRRVCSASKRREMTDCVRPEEARKIVGAQHVTHPLPRVFVAEAEKAGVRYSFRGDRGAVVVGAAGAAETVQAEEIAVRRVECALGTTATDPPPSCQQADSTANLSI
jgi:hypothetical protein